MKKISESLWILFLLTCLISPARAQSAEEKPKQGPPPAQVVTGQVTRGSVTPETVFIGTVYYPEVSDVASEVSGKVEEVRFEEGHRVKKGATLVQLDAQLLQKSIQATKASHGQVLSDLENARIDFKRIDNLYKQDSIAGRVHDESRFKMQGLAQKAASLKADVERLEIELQKKTVRAPFDGIVLQKHVNRGEWLSEGSKIASIARDDKVDILVNVPQEVIPFIAEGTDVKVQAAGKETAGKVFAIIPRGDVSTRTFPIKIRMDNTLSLIEGMEAGVGLLAGEQKESLLVPRDGVITKFGRTVLFAVADSTAKMIPVKVLGYRGMMVGVEAEGLQEGMQIVTKGNERLNDGQPVHIIQGSN